MPKSKRTIEGTCAAYLSIDGGRDPSLDNLMDRDPNDAVHRFIFYKDEAGVDTWIKVGTAKITIELDDTQDYTQNVVFNLKNEITKIQGEAEARCNALQSRINSLLCLEYIPSGE